MLRPLPQNLDTKLQEHIFDALTEIVPTHVVMERRSEAETAGLSRYSTKLVGRISQLGRVRDGGCSEQARDVNK